MWQRGCVVGARRGMGDEAEAGAEFKSKSERWPLDHSSYRSSRFHRGHSSELVASRSLSLYACHTRPPRVQLDGCGCG